MRGETKWYIRACRCAAMQRKLVTAFVSLLLLSALPTVVTADETENIPTNGRNWDS